VYRLFQSHLLIFFIKITSSKNIKLLKCFHGFRGFLLLNHLLCYFLLILFSYTDLISIQTFFSKSLTENVLLIKINDKLSNVIFKNYLQFNTFTISSYSLYITLGYLFTVDDLIILFFFPLQE
jgi:hypothetical protein